MMLSDQCKGRLGEWKFSSAAGYLDQAEPTEAERDLVEALASAFGNPGWFEGSLGVIVSAVVAGLVGPDE
jgi:hypothetical protein